MNRYLGINTVHVDVEDLHDLGMGRVEMCLGRNGGYEKRAEKMKRDIELAKERKIPFSIHLPYIIPEGFEGDYLDVFFLDPDEDKRKLSFSMLEENLKVVSELGPDYCVLHFAGIYMDCDEAHPDFEQTLNDGLKRIDALAKRYEVKVLLEYMGSNCRFYNYEAWINHIQPYESIGILTDTGHLFFSSVIHSFDYMKALEALANVSEAFHLWTTRGRAAYADSEYYRKFHHIVPHSGQCEGDEWAFDAKTVLERIARERKPMIIEASTAYGGMSYFYEGIGWAIDLIGRSIT